MSADNATVLIVEDEMLIAMNLKRILEGRGYKSSGPVSTGRAAIDAVAAGGVDIALMDIALAGDMDGIEAGRRIRSEFGVPVVYVSANADDVTVSRAKETDPFGFVGKPVQENALYLTIEMALGRRRVEIESLRLERMLRQAQKMEAVGQLAGGIAHDFNNILTAIYGYCHFLGTRKDGDESISKYVDLIMVAVKRAARLTQDLLAYSREQVLDQKPIKVNELIRTIEPLLQRLTREDIAFTCDVDEHNPAVFGDATQIEHVLMNLVTNARDAIPDGGRLTVATRLGTIDDEFTNRHGFGTPGPYAVISVSDTGVGIDEKGLSKIFEPFYTTKDIGKGTGLGLSIVYGIVKQHAGYITVDSSVGHGTEFELYLPIYTGTDKAVADGEAIGAPRGSETVLIAEDDEAVRRLNSSVLRNAGYTVIEARNGRDAVAKFRDAQETIAAVVLDAVMPNGSGWEAYTTITRIRPVPCLFLSGYGEDILASKGVVEGAVDLLKKPATPEELLRRIRRTIDRTIDGGRE